MDTSLEKSLEGGREGGREGGSTLNNRRTRKIFRLCQGTPRSHLHVPRRHLDTLRRLPSRELFSEVPIKKADFKRDTGVGAPLLGNEPSIRTLAIAPRAHNAGSPSPMTSHHREAKEEKEKEKEASTFQMTH